jgi:hypothetical protein
MMTDTIVALAIWMPLGTVVPFVLAKLTGSDWRGAFIEASIFAIIGILIFPILFALALGVIFGQPNVDVIFAISYVLALGCVLLFRRYSNKREMERRYGIR